MLCIVGWGCTIVMYDRLPYPLSHKSRRFSLVGWTSTSMLMNIVFKLRQQCSKIGNRWIGTHDYGLY